MHQYQSSGGLAFLFLKKKKEDKRVVIRLCLDAHPTVPTPWFCCCDPSTLFMWQTSCWWKSRSIFKGSATSTALQDTAICLVYFRPSPIQNLELEPPILNRPKEETSHLAVAVGSVHTNFSWTYVPVAVISQLLQQNIIGLSAVSFSGSNLQLPSAFKG